MPETDTKPRIEIPLALRNRLHDLAKAHSMSPERYLHHAFDTARHDQEAADFLCDFVMLPSVQSYLDWCVKQPVDREV